MEFAEIQALRRGLAVVTTAAVGMEVRDVKRMRSYRVHPPHPSVEEFAFGLLIVDS